MRFKRLGMMLCDEEDAHINHRFIKKNITFFEQLVVGVIGHVGTSLLELQKCGAGLIPLSVLPLPHGTLRNILTEIIFSDSKFNAYGTFFNIDSDESIAGVIPFWNYIDEPGGANLLYPYKYPFKNSYWLNNGAFVGRQKPTWRGLYHAQVSPLPSVVIANSFTITHHRSSDHRKHDGVLNIQNLNEASYDTKMALVHNLLEKSASHSLDGHTAELRGARDLYCQLTLPKDLEGVYLKMYRMRNLSYGFRIFHKLGDLEQARFYAQELTEAQQRIGLLYQRVCNHKFITQQEWSILGGAYNAITEIQYLDIMDISRYMGLDTLYVNANSKRQ